MAISLFVNCAVSAQSVLSASSRSYYRYYYAHFAE